MAGMLVQGTVEAFSPTVTRSGKADLRRRIAELLEKVGRAYGDMDHLALIRLRPSRVVWWRGWTSGTLTAR